MKTRSTILATVIALSFAASGVVSANATDSSVGYSDLVPVSYTHLTLPTIYSV